MMRLFKWRWWWLLAFPLVTLVFHASLLRYCTKLAIIDEPLPAHVEAVLIEGGDNRHDFAATWVKSGFAKTILLARPMADRNVASGVVPPEDFFDRQTLLELEVPEEAIQCLDDERLRGQWRFARLLGVWLRDHPGAKVVVLCDQFESRLTRYALNRVLPGEDAQRVAVHGLPSLAYDERLWWRSRLATINLFNSVLSMAFARRVGEDPDEPVTWDVDAYEKGIQRQ
jgi:hypothetical protein